MVALQSSKQGLTRPVHGPMQVQYHGGRARRLGFDLQFCVAVIYNGIGRGGSCCRKGRAV